MKKILNELNKVDKFFLEAVSLQCSNLIQDKEAKDYLGCSFNIGNRYVKCRKAKITPKKSGFFVTLWKRNEEHKSEPYNASDKYDFYMILTEEHENYGFFLFPKNELIKRKILSTEMKEGKRGFRVYPNWVNTANEQARKTSSYFFKFSAENKMQVKFLLATLNNL